MTKIEILERMNEIDIKCKDDEEAFNVLAIDLMCEILNSTGYDYIVNWYRL